MQLRPQPQRRRPPRAFGAWERWPTATRLHGIDIEADRTRRLAVVDPGDHHLFASLGCAAENLLIAAGARSKHGAVRLEARQPDAVSLVFANAEPVERALYAPIPQRQSTRGDFDGRQVSANDLAQLAGNGAQLADPAFRRELASWRRFNPHQALAAGDGLFSAASGNPSLPSWLAPFEFDLVFKAGPENDRYARQIATSAGIAVFVAQQDNREHWVAAGRACQRFALQATALGLKHAFLNQPVEVADLRPALPFSLRRPVAAVFA